MRYVKITIVKRHIFFQTLLPKLFARALTTTFARASPLFKKHGSEFICNSCIESLNIFRKFLYLSGIQHSKPSLLSVSRKTGISHTSCFKQKSCHVTHVACIENFVWLVRARTIRLSFKILVAKM